MQDQDSLPQNAVVVNLAAVRRSDARHGELEHREEIEVNVARVEELDLSLPYTKEQVERGRAIVKALDGGQWQLGDLALEIWPMTTRGDKTGSTEGMKEYAEEVGLEVETLRKYRQIAWAWRKNQRHSTVSFAVHQTLAGNDERLEILRGLIKQNKGKRVTVQMARDAIKPVSVPTPDPKESSNEGEEEKDTEEQPAAESESQTLGWAAVLEQAHKLVMDATAAFEASAERMSEEDHNHAGEIVVNIEHMLEVDMARGK